jgi:hypothetical protein
MHEPGKNAETFVLYRIVLVIVIIVILVLVVIVILFPLNLPRDPFSQAPRPAIPPHHEVNHLLIVGVATRYIHPISLILRILPQKRYLDSTGACDTSSVSSCGIR